MKDLWIAAKLLKQLKGDDRWREKNPAHQDGIRVFIFTNRQMIPLSNNTINPTPRAKMYAPATTASTPDNTPETISKTILKILSTINCKISTLIAPLERS